MSTAARVSVAPATQALFDLNLPSPLPELPELPLAERDPIAFALAEAAASEARHDAPEAQQLAWLRVVHAWAMLHAVAPALEALSAAVLVPDSPAVQEALATLLPQAGRHREAARVVESIARTASTVPTWMRAARLWLRADAPDEAARCVAEARKVNDEDPRLRGLELTIARIQSSGGRGGDLVSKLVEASEQARRRDDRERWRALASDGWIESRGHAAGDVLTEALAATGHPRAAVYIAAETAARAIEKGVDAHPFAAQMLARCARLAEGAGLPGEATAAWTVLSLLGDLPEAREALRDQLAERGRPVELAARLRADARRATVQTASAAWKGVAAIEIPYAPAQAAGALTEALRHQPDDPEAFDLLSALALDPLAESALRDSLWSLARAPKLPNNARVRIAVWLSELEERAGDPASAEAVLALASNHSEALRARERLRPTAEELGAMAAKALEELPPDATGAVLERFLATWGRCPGAFRDPRLVSKHLAPIGLRDDRVAALWGRIVARSDDRSQRLMVLRRLATRSMVSAVRVQAAVAYAELLDHPDGAPADAAELLQLLLDELPEEPSAASTLAAIAEHLNDPTLSLSALRAVARATNDPWERDMLSRFTGSEQGIFAVFASCLTDPKSSRERAANLTRLNDLLGDGVSILAQRTRLLLAQNAPHNDGLDLARRFSAFEPDSPEAAIAWFSSASLAGESQQIALAARAVQASVATARDLSAVTRAAVARLAALQQISTALDVATLTAETDGITDRALRTQLLELLADHHGHVGAVTILEGIIACAQDAGEPLREALTALAFAQQRRGNPLGTAKALGRLRSRFADATVDPALEEFSTETPSLGALSESIQNRLRLTLDPEERRQLYLHNVSVQIALHPGNLDPAVASLDRYADEQQDSVAHGDVMRCLLSLGLPQLALERLLRWSGQCLTPEEAGPRSLAAARIAYERLGNATRALSLLREQLSRDEAVPDALDLAEKITLETRQREAMMALYEELADNAAGAHGRNALAYRRAVFLERAGDPQAALAAHLALFESAPGLGASFSAIERLAQPAGRVEVLVRALVRLADDAPTPEARARFLRRAATVARELAHDPRGALSLEVSAYKLQSGGDVERALLEHARALAATHPLDARVAVEQVIEERLSHGDRTWDDTVRRAHAIFAASLAIRELHDPRRLSEAVALFMRQHEEPDAGRAEILAMLASTNASESLRAVALAAPGMSAPSLPPQAALPIASEPPPTPPSVRASEPPPTLLDPPPAARPSAPATPPSEPLVASDVPTVASPSETPVEPPLEVLPEVLPEVVIEAPSEEVDEAFVEADEASAEPGVRVSSSPVVVPAVAVEAPAETPVAPAPEDEAPRVNIPTPILPLSNGTTRRNTVPPPPSEVTLVEVPLERLSEVELRRASAEGNDAAASVLAERLTADEDSRDEALSLQRRRFMEDPSRLDALDAMVKLYHWSGMHAESLALESVLSVLSGDPVAAAPPLVHELADPPDGVARVLFPPRWGLFDELGGLLWQSLGPLYRRAARAQEPQRSIDPQSPVGRMFTGALRLLGLPRNTPMTLRESVPEGASVVLAQPPGVVLARPFAIDTPRTRFLVGRALEGVRQGHTLIAALPPDEAQRMMNALLVIVGASVGRPEPAVRQFAASMAENIAPRALKRIEDLVAELGPRLSYAAWSDAVELARAHAGMLVSGDFFTAASEVLRAHPSGGGITTAIRVNEHLRELTRFACSEMYLLLRWHHR